MGENVLDKEAEAVMKTGENCGYYPVVLNKEKKCKRVDSCDIMLMMFW